MSVTDDAPVSNRLIEQGGTPKHITHARHVTNIPSTNVLVESRSVLESLVHVRHTADVPVADVTISGRCARLVGKPQVDGFREIRVGEGEGRTFVERVYFVGQKDAVPNPEIIELALEVGGVVLRAVADGEQVARIGNGGSVSVDSAGVGRLYAAEIKRSVGSACFSVPSECDVGPLILRSRVGGGVGGVATGKLPDPGKIVGSRMKPPISYRGGSFGDEIASAGTDLAHHPSGKGHRSKVVQQGGSGEGT